MSSFLILAFLFVSLSTTNGFEILSPLKIRIYNEEFVSISVKLTDKELNN